MPSPYKKIPTKFPGYYVTSLGEVFRDTSEGLVEVKQFARGGAGGNLYKSVNISLRDERGKFLKQIKKYTHRLIAETLLPNPEGFSEVNHIDEDKSNNKVSNLQWMSHRDNLKYSEVGFKPGNKHNRFCNDS